MTIILGLFFILLSLLFYILNNKITSPLVLVPSSWGFTLLLYGLVNHGMPSLSVMLLFIVFLWTISMILGISLFNYYRVDKVFIKQKLINFVNHYDLNTNKILKRNLNVYYWLSVLLFFPQVYLSYKQAMSGGENVFLNMRLVSAGLIESEYSVGIFGYGKTFTIVCLLVYLLVYRNGESKIRIYILFIIYFILSILAVGKSQFLFLIISMSLVWSYTKTISKKTIVAGLSFILIVFSLLQLARSDDKDESQDVISGMFYTYLFGGLPALDLITNSEMKSSEFGQNSLQFFSRFIKSFGNSSNKTESTYENDITYEGYLFVPNPTNVYTIIGPFWLDFRYYGVAIFGFLYGLLFGFLYKRALQMKIYGIVTYCLFVSALILPFFGEFIFAYLSYFIQVFILSYFVDKSIVRKLYSFLNLNKEFSL